MHIGETELAQLAASLRRIERAEPRPTRSGLLASLRALFGAAPATARQARRVWYQGGERYFDVFIDLDEAGEPSWLQLTLRGRTVTWESGRNRVWTGYTNEAAAQPHHPAAKIVTTELTPDHAMIDLAQALLACRPDDAVLSAALACLRHARRVVVAI